MWMIYYWGLGVSEWFGPFTTEESAKQAIEDNRPDGADYCTVVQVAPSFDVIPLE